MVDPDAPSAAQPVNKHWRHWLLFNPPQVLSESALIVVGATTQYAMTLPVAEDLGHMVSPNEISGEIIDQGRFSLLNRDCDLRCAKYELNDNGLVDGEHVKRRVGPAISQF
ncbi:hypothetical protein C8F01DRAFT_1087913 [Mycena amicta]|nr:hypothetical protein C8F01DRAFT_1087913 [Mycena amicta]